VLGSQAAYAQWASQYPAEAHNVLMQVEEAAMLALLPEVRSQTVLDLACGTGRWAKIAVKRGAKLVIGTDNSLAMLQSSQLANRVEAEMTCLPLGDTCIDVLLCGLAIGHLLAQHMRQAFAEMGRVLKPGGVALVSDFHPFIAWAGGQRTFKGEDGQTYAVEHYVHGYADLHRAAQSAGLTIETVQEPTHPENIDSPPIVLVLRLKKSSS
jgi:ubiquinone/menaquinone biosynthesis C-methylase UbiE